VKPLNPIMISGREMLRWSKRARHLDLERREFGGVAASRRSHILRRQRDSYDERAG